MGTYQGSRLFLGECARGSGGWNGGLAEGHSTFCSRGGQKSVLDMCSNLCDAARHAPGGSYRSLIFHLHLPLLRVPSALGPSLYATLAREAVWIRRGPVPGMFCHQRQLRRAHFWTKRTKLTRRPRKKPWKFQARQQPTATSDRSFVHENAI